MSTLSILEDLRREHVNSMMNGNDASAKGASSDRQSSSESSSNSVTQESAVVQAPTTLKPQKRCILTIVSLTLLLDGMLNMVILPIIPEYLKYLPSLSAHDTTTNESSTTTTSTSKSMNQIKDQTFEYNQNDLAIGFLFATKPLIQLIVNPFTGTLIDHIGYKIPMIVGLLIQLASTIVFTATNSLDFLFVARSLQGVGSALADTSAFSMIADCFREQFERSKALGIAITSLALGSFMSVPFSGILFEYVGKKTPFILLSVLAFVVLVLLLVNMRSNYYLYSNTKRSVEEGKIKKTAIWNLFLDPYVAICSLALIMANVPLAFTEPAIAVWMKKTMNSSESQVGLIWLSGFIPHLSGVYLTVYLIKRYAQHQYLFIIFGLLLEALACLWIPFINQYGLLFVPIVVICFGYGLIDATILPTMAYLVDTRHASVYGSVYAIVDISYSLVYAFGPMLAGVVLHFIGFIGLSIITCVIIVIYTPFVCFLRKIYLLKSLQNANTENNNIDRNNNNNEIFNP